MIKDNLIDRIKELELAVEKSAANHNALVGRLIECRELLSKLEQQEENKVEEERININDIHSIE